MYGKAKVLAVTVICSLFAFQANAAQIIRKVNYFTVKGKTAAELDRSLEQSGPLLKSTGKRHPGATKIRFDAKVKYGALPGEACKVQNVYVNVHATVSLPRWKQRHKADFDLALIWDTLAQDIKRHEESHIVIARSHASNIEYALRALPSRSDCTLLRADIDKITATILADHDKAQQYYEHVEAVNFDSRFARLLDYRLQQLAQ